ncbi:glycosyltransferase family 76 protein [Gonapodya prolifera JEL478]|uniref:GPI mannosyltransferase 2 n=1 Tax=Gonapodya prolifera (strain JEL478) TaxID=1344416 RepID=A0A139AKM8_GONPJ|nr:glycosyltransferase family 76 protein [Gonapodya prolifera JEL478]|eukprot:KXS17326.1 glycosyltransferase family 76 protein [Gonapodya prolifera JEL478]
MSVLETSRAVLAIDEMLQSLFKWDSIHFHGVGKMKLANGSGQVEHHKGPGFMNIDVASPTYLYEQQLAFFPLLPGLLRLGNAAYTILDPSNSLLPASTVYLIAGVIFTNSCFVFSVRSLFRLSMKLQASNQSLATVACILYCLSPAGIFLSAIYTESPFNCFTLQALNCYSDLLQNVTVAFPKRLQTAATTVMYLVLATAIRSNGAATAGLLWGWYALMGLGAERRESGTFSAISIVRLALRAFASLILLLLSISPLIAFQYWATRAMCVGETPRPWCSDTIPVPYAFVQKFYWGNGLFAYWTLNNAGYFVLASGMLLWCFYSVYSYGREVVSSFRITIGIDDAHTTQDHGPANLALTPIVLLHAFLTISCLVSMHVQILTRLVSGLPTLYWAAAKWCLNEDSRGGREVLNEGRFKMVLLCVMGYAAAGAVLFGAFLPPA